MSHANDFVEGPWSQEKELPPSPRNTKESVQGGGLGFCEATFADLWPRTGRGWEVMCEHWLASPAILKFLSSWSLSDMAISSLFQMLKAWTRFTVHIPASLGSWDSCSFEEHRTFRGSGRSAESFSANSWIGEWKKRELVCHRRPSCFCATAFTFLEQQESRDPHAAGGHVPPNTHTLAIEPKHGATSQIVSRGWFHPHVGRALTSRAVWQWDGWSWKVVGSSPREVFQRRPDVNLSGIVEEKFLLQDTDSLLIRFPY